MFVLDSHCDTPSQIKRLRDLALDNSYAQVDFPKLRRGSVDGAFFALYTPASYPSEAAYRNAYELLGLVKETVARCSGEASFAMSPDEAMANKADGLFSVCIGMENGSPLGDSLERIDEFYNAGVRYMTLCHSRDNLICDSCAQGSTWHGLSAYGRDVVKRMNSLGTIVDLSHASDETFYDVMRYSSAPVAATHSCCRALASHKRNMTDDMLRALAGNGGVIQINFYPVFLDDGFARIMDESGLYEKEYIEDRFIADPANGQYRKEWYALLDELAALERPSFRRIVDHIDHAVEIAGIDHVGLGSDFDGIGVTPSGMEDAGCFPVIFEELRARGYTEEDIAKIAGGNFLRLWNDVLNLRQK
ncbi:MAG: dipeptidase [Bacteroidales bacterium]|nr:dipeptidase [Bacteroidales bacterium]